MSAHPLPVESPVLPVSPDEPALIVKPLSSNGAPPVLLVVDDQPANVHALYQLFAQDHQVLMATRGELAIKLCHDRQPDLVLLDVVMPGMDGYEVCARLKADPTTRDIPVIFVTADQDEQAETRGLDAGAVDFISKPINPRVVRARVRTHLTLKRHADRLQSLAFIDGLTGIHNRRGLDATLSNEARRAARTGMSLTVMMIDVDHFKRFNDRYGHQSGDDCLRQLASALAGVLRRPADLLARYGGEEFAAVLPETDLAAACTLAETMVRSVRALRIAHAGSDVDQVVTVSVGVATLQRGDKASPQQLLEGADRQLYLAKAGGRGRVCAALLSVEPPLAGG
jgi:diguanylate cyclase (GGDEF)-like protein